MAGDTKAEGEGDEDGLCSWFCYTGQRCCFNSPANRQPAQPSLTVARDLGGGTWAHQLTGYELASSLALSVPLVHWSTGPPRLPANGARRLFTPPLHSQNPHGAHGVHANCLRTYATACRHLLTYPGTRVGLAQYLLGR